MAQAQGTKGWATTHTLIAQTTTGRIPNSGEAVWRFAAPTRRRPGRHANATGRMGGLPPSRSALEGGGRDRYVRLQPRREAVVYPPGFSSQSGPRPLPSGHEADGSRD